MAGGIKCIRCGGWYCAQVVKDAGGIMWNEIIKRGITQISTKEASVMLGIEEWKAKRALNKAVIDGLLTRVAHGKEVVYIRK